MKYYTPVIYVVYTIYFYWWRSRSFFDTSLHRFPRLRIGYVLIVMYFNKILCNGIFRMLMVVVNCRIYFLSFFMVLSRTIVVISSTRHERLASGDIILRTKPVSLFHSSFLISLRTIYSLLFRCIVSTQDNRKLLYSFRITGRIFNAFLLQKLLAHLL